MLNNFKKLNRKYFIAGFLFLLVFCFVVGVDMVQAETAQTIIGTTGGIADAIMKVLGWIFYIIAAIIGYILMLLIQILVDVAGFSNIINVFAVRTGWVIVRDLCNMFFILILLVIAFATILRIESYSAKRLLPKLLIMAVLINFSKTIFGLIIDFAQVIMLTFVNGFGQYGANNLVNLFQINKYLAFGNTASNIEGGDSLGKIGTWETTGAVLAGFFAIIITTITVAVLLVVLIFRIIMLWVYTILSPLVFFGAAFPGGQKYTSRIWEDFIKQVLVGPLLAFFIWLALLTASQSTQELKIADQTKSGGTTVNFCSPNNSLFCSKEFTAYIITIALLIGGLMVTQQMGGVAGSMAGKGMQWAKRAGAVGVAGALLPFKGAKSLAGYGIDKLQQKKGVDLNVARVWRGIQERRKEIKQERYVEGMGVAKDAMQNRGRLYGALAMSGTPQAAWDQIWTKKGRAMRRMGGVKARVDADKLQGKIKVEENKIKQIKEGDEYKKAKEISERGITRDIFETKSKEQPKLVKETERLQKIYKMHQERYNRSSGVEKNRAQKDMDRVKEDKKNLEAQYEANEKILSAPAHLVLDQADIDKAKADLGRLGIQIKGDKETGETGIRNIKDEIINKYSPIPDFEASAAYGSLVSKEQQKYAHIHDMEELSSMLRASAGKGGNKIRYAAIAKKLAVDGNENDGIFNNLGYNSDGIRQWSTDIANPNHKNYAGFTGQEAKALAMEISYLGEKNGHVGIARAIKMENGRYRDASEKEQVIAVASEAAKMDPQAAAKMFNRLAFVTERPDGTSYMNAIGKALAKTIGAQMAKQANRINPNAMAVLGRQENIKVLNEIEAPQKYIDVLQAETSARDRTAHAMESVAYLIKKGEIKDDV